MAPSGGSEYIPDAGHIVWISLDPQRGREHAGRRPFLVLTPRAYNAKTSLAVGVPITSRSKKYPFEVPLGASGAIAGVVLADQVKSLDWRARQAEFSEHVAPPTLAAVKRLLSTLLAIT